MMSVATISFATVLLFAPTPPRAEPVDIPVEEWREIALGRTLTYRINGEFFALERYAERGDRVWLQMVDGTCLEGTWGYEAPLYCYFWTGLEPVCFRHVRNSDRVLVLETEDGVETGETQTMAGISDTPLTCAPMLSS